jgi:uncharacterized membrane protein
VNTALWIVQGLLASVFVVAGATQAIVPREKLLTRMAWAADFSDFQVKVLGLLEILGAAALVVPWLTRTLVLLTPLAAAGLAILMAGAAYVHLRRGEPASPPLLLGALALFVAIGRFAEAFA